MARSWPKDFCFFFSTDFSSHLNICSTRISFSFYSNWMTIFPFPFLFKNLVLEGDLREFSCGSDYSLLFLRSTPIKTRINISLMNIYFTLSLILVGEGWKLDWSALIFGICQILMDNRGIKLEQFIEFFDGRVLQVDSCKELWWFLSEIWWFLKNWI